MIVVWQAFECEGRGRAEAKALGRDAVRQAFARAVDAWSARFGAAPWARATIRHDAEGAPVLDAPGAPRISVTHGHGLAGIAIAAPDTPWVGLDAERTDAPGMRGVRELSQRSGEAGLPWPDDQWPARLWCAKEAAVKAERQGADLLGRTLRVERILVPAATHCASLGEGASHPVGVLVRTHHGRLLLAHTGRIGPFTVAAIHQKTPSTSEGAGAT